MAGTLQLNRDQLQVLCSDSKGVVDFDMVRKFEQAFIGIEQIPSLEDGQDDNTLAISTLSDLVRPITINLIQPLPAPVSSNTTYTLIGGEATEGMKTIFIPSASLIASAGGPFTLTISTGIGTVCLVPISANGDTITSGDLMFDIHIDSAQNIAAKAWDITGSNSNGFYQKKNSGYMEQWGQIAGMLVADGTAPVVFPTTFSSAPIIWTGHTISATSASVSSTTSIISSSISVTGCTLAQDSFGTNAINETWLAKGRWTT
jgi:hypothetical protein